MAIDPWTVFGLAAEAIDLVAGEPTDVEPGIVETMERPPAPSPPEAGGQNTGRDISDMLAVLQNISGTGIPDRRIITKAIGSKL